MWELFLSHVNFAEGDAKKASGRPTIFSFPGLTSFSREVNRRSFVDDTPVVGIEMNTKVLATVKFPNPSKRAVPVAVIGATHSGKSTLIRFGVCFRHGSILVT